MGVRVRVRGLGLAYRVQQAEQAQRGDDDAGRDERPAQEVLDVVEVRAVEADPDAVRCRAGAGRRPALLASQQHPPDEHRHADREHEGRRARTAARSRRPKVPACSAISFRSTIGPTTRNASRAVSENWVRLAATNASASEQIASITASSASASDRQHGVAGDGVEPLARDDDVERRGGHAADDEEPAGVQQVVAHAADERVPACRRRRSRARRRTRSQLALAEPQPEPAHRRRRRSSEAANRADDHLRLAREGHGGRDQHHRVDRGGRQQERQRGRRRRRRGPSGAPATGTDAHSQPGSTAPGDPGDRHRERRALRQRLARTSDAGTNAVIAADSSDAEDQERQRLHQIATKTVAQVASAGRSNNSRSGPESSSRAASVAQRT